MKPELLINLPGAELVLGGLQDLALGKTHTIEALLVAIGSPRLRRLGFDLPYSFPEMPEHELYLKLGVEHGLAAHSQYNALVRRLVSFERALDGRLRRDRAD